MIELTRLPWQKSALIKELELDQFLKERLHKFGFIPGERIELVRVSPFGGPRVYRILNTLVVLRNKIANKIIVEVHSGKENN